MEYKDFLDHKFDDFNCHLIMIRGSSQMKWFLFYKSRVLLSTTILLHCNYQQGTEEQLLCSKVFKIITQQLKSKLKNILFLVDWLSQYWCFIIIIQSLSSVKMLSSSQEFILIKFSTKKSGNIQKNDDKIRILNVTIESESQTCWPYQPCYRVKGSSSDSCLLITVIIKEVVMMCEGIRKLHWSNCELQKRNRFIGELPRIYSRYEDHDAKYLQTYFCSILLNCFEMTKGWTGLCGSPSYLQQ